VVEHRADNAVVEGSIPSPPMFYSLSSVVERLVYTQEVAGSIPAGSIVHHRIKSEQ